MGRGRTGLTKDVPPSPSSIITLIFIKRVYLLTLHLYFFFNYDFFGDDGEISLTLFGGLSTCGSRQSVRGLSSPRYSPSRSRVITPEGTGTPDLVTLPRTVPHREVGTSEVDLCREEPKM